MKKQILLFIFFVLVSISNYSQNKLKDSSFLNIGFRELSLDQINQVNTIISNDSHLKPILFCKNFNVFCIQVIDTSNFSKKTFIESIQKYTYLTPVEKVVEFRAFVNECDDKSKFESPEIKPYLN